MSDRDIRTAAHILCALSGEEAVKHLRKVIDEVVKDERAACAQIAEQWDKKATPGLDAIGTYIAQDIRARGE